MWETTSRDIAVCLWKHIILLLFLCFNIYFSVFDLLHTWLLYVVNCRQRTRVIKLADGKELSEGNRSCYYNGTATPSVEHHQRCICQNFIISVQGCSQDFYCGRGEGLSHRGAETKSRRRQGRAKGVELRFCRCLGGRVWEAGVPLPSGGGVWGLSLIHISEPTRPY